jgi:hypothetical protein
MTFFPGEKFKELGAKAFRSGKPCDPEACQELQEWREKNPAFTGNCLKEAWIAGWKGAVKVAKERTG